MDEKRNADLALVGGGTWGKNLVRNFHEAGALHTVCDLDKKSLSFFKKPYPNIEVTTDYESVVANPKIRKIAIATPPNSHFELANKAIVAKKDVYVEKPLFFDTLEGEDLVHFAEERKLILMVGHILHYHPCVQRLKEMIKMGEVGKLHYICSNRLNLGAIRTRESSLWCSAPHDVSVIRALCGNMIPKQVRCVGSASLSKDVSDITLTTLRFSDDLRAHIYTSWLNPFKEQKLTIVGSTGMVVFDDTLPWEEKLVIYRDYVTWSDEGIPIPNKITKEAIEVSQSEPLRNEVEHFLECCEKRERPYTDGYEGLEVLKVLQAAQASLDEDGEAKDPSEPYSVTHRSMKPAIVT